MSEFLEIAATSVPQVFQLVTNGVGMKNLSSLYRAMENKVFSFNEIIFEIVDLPAYVKGHLVSNGANQCDIVYFRMKDEFLRNFRRELISTGECEKLEKTLLDLLFIEEVRSLILDGGGNQNFTNLKSNDLCNLDIRTILISSYVTSANNIIGKS